MKEIPIYISIVVAILSLAYPILLQVIARLDEKYGSIRVVELFDNEKVKKWFQGVLVFALLAIFVWSFRLEPLSQLANVGWIIDNSANLLVLASATALVIIFFLFIDKVLVYYTPSKFAEYLMRKHKAKIANLAYFSALNDVFLSSIRHQNYAISSKIRPFYYEEFNSEREKQKDKPVEYPREYYSLVHNTIEELAILPYKKNRQLEYRAAGGVWLLGDNPSLHHEISDATYNWMWRNIILMLRYEQDLMILYFWQRSHQYLLLHLESILPELERSNKTDETVIINSGAIEKRKQERERFLEFHYALGGLILYKRKYAVLKKMLDHTTTQPPRYVLLPSSMNEIFKWYILFKDVYQQDIIMTQRYNFPDQSGLHAEDVTKDWICTFLEAVFYTIAISIGRSFGISKFTYRTVRKRKVDR